MQKPIITMMDRFSHKFINP